jgi:AraC-like DNA-binding protein
METGHFKTNVAAAIKAYVTAHLQDPITASDLAKAVGYSQYHATRLFKTETGLSPFEYIRRERLLHSARALRKGGSRVMDVALDFVFDSHEGFTRAFANAFGITPKKYASLRGTEGWLVPICYLNRHQTESEGKTMEDRAAFIFTQIVERPARKLILKRSLKATDYFEYCEEVGCGNSDFSEPWETLCGIKEALYEPVGVWLPENMRPEGTGLYAHGVEVPENYAGAIPEGFDVIKLKACQMMVFQGEPYDNKDFEKEVGLCMERIEKFNPEVYGYQFADELAPRMQLAPWGWRGYIEMRPVREMK